MSETNHGMYNQKNNLWDGTNSILYGCITNSLTDGIMSYGMYNQPVLFFGWVCLKNVKMMMNQST